MPPDASLTVHADRLFPSEPGARQLARELYDEVARLPLIAPHGHVEASLLWRNEAFPDPASLFVTTDHYVTRLLHANGIPLDRLGVGKFPLPPHEARQIWRILCEHWSIFRGSTVRYWLEAELAEIFGVTLRPSSGTADAIFEQISDQLSADAYRPRTLYERFGIEVLATTDDPADDLSAHAALRDDRSWTGRVIPTFRPDKYLELGFATWRESVQRLGLSADVDTGSYVGYLRALEARRRYFIAHGATATDHSHLDAGTAPLEPHEAERIYRSALVGDVNDADATAFRRHMLLEMARMSCDDGLVMTIHPGVVRDYHRATAGAFGPDTGHDIPVALEYTRSLRPLLERYGTHPNLNLVLYTIDETVWSRELAPLAGFFPSVYIGAPWWFLDSTDAIRRFRAAVTDIAGYTRTAGFVDDTRAFCSIPVRHDLARRIDSGLLAQRVLEHRLDEDEALEIAVALVTDQPRTAYKL